jgi:hypothetical protein
MLPTDREVLAYDIRRDAEYTRQRLEERAYEPDSPTLPAMLAAAHRFCQWCEAASDELLTNPDAGVDEIREAWRREAVASDVRFIPHGDLAALSGLGFGSLAAVCTRSSLWRREASVCGSPPPPSGLRPPRQSPTGTGRHRGSQLAPTRNAQPWLRHPAVNCCNLDAQNPSRGGTNRGLSGAAATTRTRVDLKAQSSGRTREKEGPGDRDQAASHSECRPARSARH